MRANKFVNTILPPFSERRKKAKRIAVKTHIIPNRHPDPNYLSWQIQTEPGIWNNKTQLVYEPLFSIVVPVFNTADKYLLPMVYSAVNQKYPNWELVIANGSTDEKRRQAASRMAEIDNRIKVIELSENLGIAKNTNAAIEAASGDYVVFMDHDDIISPHALHEVALSLQGDEKPELLYSDEDKLSDDGQFRFDPFFKPDWSPDLLLQLNYITHLTIVNKVLLKKVKGIRVGVEGAQDYDLLLRLMQYDPKVKHIPKILYHWRTIKGSTAQDFSSKSYVLESGTKALADFYGKKGIEADVTPMLGKPGFYKTNYKVPSTTKVSVLVIPGGSSSAYTFFVKALLSKLKNCKLNTELVVSQPLTIDGWLEPDAALVKVDAKEPAEFIKQAEKMIKGNVIVCLSAAIIPHNDNWIEEIAAVALQDHVAAVAPLVFSKSQDKIFDSGIVYGNNSEPYRLFQGYKRAKHTYFGDTDWVRDVDRVSGLVFATKKTSFAKSLKGNNPIRCGVLSDDFITGLGGADQYHVIWPFVEVELSGSFLLANNTPKPAKFFNPNLKPFGQKIKLPIGYNQEHSAHYDGEV